MGHIFIEIKFCVWGVEGTNFVLNNKLYDQLLSFFYIKIAIWKWFIQYFSSYLHEKYCIFALYYVDNLYKDLTNWCENTMFSCSCKWLEKKW